MKVLITTDWYRPAVNGVVTSVRNLAEGLKLDAFLAPLPPAERSALRAKLGLGADDLALTFVGRLAKEKNVSELLAFLPAAPRNVKLLLVGDGPCWHELEAQAREAEAALQENERLRNLLELQPKEWSCDKAAAMVTARSTSNWESTLTIGKGSAAGIAVDDCVVDEYWNLVGVVAEVGENWATVRTLVDSDTEMGGQLARTGGAAILEGDFALMGEGRLKLTYLPENSELIAGDLVTTSGRGGVYPAGLVAGHVEEVCTDASGMTRYAVIAPETDLDGLQQVFVITDFTVNE